MDISYDEFSKCDLRVVTIMNANRIEGSEKLLILNVSLGTEERQIIAGIGRQYEPEQLIGRQVVIIANLEPRMLMGMTSQGMLLAAGDSDPVLLQPDKPLEPGSKIH